MNQNEKINPGCIHVYCGDGKGKSTAAIGLVIRAAGHGKRVLLVQFLKDGSSGELAILRQLTGIEVITGQLVRKFSFAMNEQEKKRTCDLHRQYLSDAAGRVQADPIDLLILDEVLGAIETNLLPEAELIRFLREKPPQLEVVLTGRKLTPSIEPLADYISEIRCLRHPYENGIPARPGIEY